MLVTDKRMMSIADTRAITSVTVSRTSSLKEPYRSLLKEDPSSADSASFSLNKRSLSNEKMSSDYVAPVFASQRGSSLRNADRPVLPMSSPNSSNRHPFKIIKPIDTSPRASESNIECSEKDILSVKTSQRLKFKHRTQAPSTGGPLIPDHSLMKEPSRENIHFTPRPPLLKKFSSDQDEPGSDIDSGQTKTATRYYPVCSATVAPRPPFSPTRGLIQPSKLSGNNAIANSIDKNNSEEDSSEIEDIRNSDCETPPPTETVVSTTHRSSLRKGSDSPNQSDVPGRASPSPTKTVKWNMNTEVKKIPRSRSLNGKVRSSKTRSQRSAADRSAKLLNGDQRLIECHESYISHCTALIRHQVSLLESLRHDRISVPHYKKDLTDVLDHQKRLVANLQTILTDLPVPGLDSEKSVQGPL